MIADPDLDRPVRFVAEVSSNHNRSLERCLSFVDEAARIGCQAVKFQLFRIDHLFAPEILQRSEKHRQRRDWELPKEYLPQIAKRCKDVGLQFGCTPFDLEGVADLAAHVDFLKISSYDILRLDLLRLCAQTGLPLVISTGMATMQEVMAAVDEMRGAGAASICVLHCVSNYPTRPRDANLAAIATLRQSTGCDVGWSDHTVSEAVIQRAILRWRASMIEFHLDLEGDGAEFAAGHCWRPEAMERVIRSIEVGCASDGHGRREPIESELVERDWRADPIDGLRPFKAIREDWKRENPK